MNFSVYPWDCIPGRNEVHGADIPALVCPSDLLTPSQYLYDDQCAYGQPFTNTNDFASRGSYRTHAPFSCLFIHDMPKHNGVFLKIMISVRYKEISDGLSQTIAVGERPVDSEHYYGWWSAGGGTDCHGLGDTVIDLNDGHYQGDNDNPADLSHYWSMHDGGSNMLFCDGSVRFISYSVDHDSYLAMGSRYGNETGDSR